jgi:threonine/homoserine/homoserine lactone efflux protein
MIEPHTFWTFIGAVVILVLAPGPDMAYMLTRTIAQGRKAGAVAAIGINVGAYVHVLGAVLGLSAILAASSVAFTIVKWAGACYLVWIGLQALLRANPFNLKDGPSVEPDLGTISGKAS